MNEDFKSAPSAEASAPIDVASLKLVRVQATFSNWKKITVDCWTGTAGFVVPVPGNFEIIACLQSRVIGSHLGVYPGDPPIGNRSTHLIKSVAGWDSSSITVVIGLPWTYPNDTTRDIVLKEEFILFLKLP